MNDGLIAIWRKHAPGEKFGEFLYKSVRDRSVWEHEDESEAVAANLHNADHVDLLRMARERFGIEE